LTHIKANFLSLGQLKLRRQSLGLSWIISNADSHIHPECAQEEEDQTPAQYFDAVHDLDIARSRSNYDL
jgi:hypothetical protein